MNAPFTPDRRLVLKIGAAAGALFVAAPLGAAKAARQAREGFASNLGLYVRIGADNSVAIASPSSEIGQGTATSLPMLVAEELDVDFARVSVDYLPLMLRWDEAAGGFRVKTFTLGAGDSTSVWRSYDRARQAGAAARRLLLQAAAKTWDVPLAALATEDGVIRHAASGRSAPYGDFVALAAAEELPEGEELPLKPREEQKIVGKPQKHKQLREIVTGAPLYGIDQEVEGMLHAVVARAPRFDAKIVGVDESAARAIPGVRHIVRLDGPEVGGEFTEKPIADGVAVVADSLWAAMKGRDALEVTWSDGPMKGVSSADIAARIDRQLAEEPGQEIRRDGDVEAAFDAADRIVEARYDVPIVSHAPLEPQNAIADVRADSCRVIAPTQDPFDCAAAAANITGLEHLKVHVQPTRSGGGFGRRLDTDYAVEAILLSKAVGAPVKVQWTREDDMAHDYYRPLVHHRMRAALDAGGKVTAWEHRLASTGRYFRRGVPPERYFIPEYWTDDLPARLIPNMAVDYHFVETAIPFGPWRAPGHTANAFAVQAFLDEIAEAAGKDPLALRLELLGEAREIPYEQHGGPVFDTGRLAAVLRSVAERGGWGERLPQGRGRGIAGHFTFGTYCAHVVDVTVENGDFTVDRVVSAVDCGIAVNPNGVRAQVEGGINDALSTARGQEITIEDGKVVQANFDRYEMMRMDRAATDIDVAIIDSGKDVRGMGEPPVPPLAPALVGALHAATGKRIRKLPIKDQLRSA